MGCGSSSENEDPTTNPIEKTESQFRDFEEYKSKIKKYITLK